MPRGCVCGFVRVDRISRRSTPNLNECCCLSHEKLFVRCSVLPMRTELVDPGEAVLLNPDAWQLAIPDVSGWSGRFPFGIPSRLFSAIPKSSAVWWVTYLLNPARTS